MNLAQISWGRLLVEAAAVVLSILLAFAIDAAWDARQEREADTARLSALYEELQSHDRLLEEAMAAHRHTVVYGYELLELLGTDITEQSSARISELLDELLNFYRINAPFGSLETAIASGAIARMQNVGLASDLASWPTSIDDLLEEENTGGEVLVTELYAELGRSISLRDALQRRLTRPSIRGTRETLGDVAIGALPDTLAAPDYSQLRDNVVFANRIMYLMMMAQASQGEATLASQKLERLMTALADCLDAKNC